MIPGPSSSTAGPSNAVPASPADQRKGKGKAFAQPKRKPGGQKKPRASEAFSIPEALLDPEENEDDEDLDSPVEIDLRPFDALIQWLKLDIQTLVEGLRLCSLVPIDSFLRLGFRISHAPIDNTCPFCDHAFPSPPLRGASDARTTWHRATQQHVNQCASQRALDQVMPRLLVEYSDTCERNTLLPPQGKEKNNSISVFSLHKRWLAAFSSTITKDLPKRQVDKEYPTCLVCPSHPSIYSASQALEHSLVSHHVWAPPSHPKNGGPLKEVEWNAVTTNFPTPPYYASLARYLPDPLSAAQMSRRLYLTEIVAPARDIEHYGIATDIDIPADALQGDRATYLDSDGQERPYPPDTKYLYPGSAGRLIPADNDAFCYCCANHPFRSMTERMAPHNTGLSYFKLHARDCIMTILVECLRLKRRVELGLPAPHRHTPYWDQGELLCLDPSCLAQNRRFDSKLAWVEHLVGVHLFRFKGARTRTGSRLTLAELTFDSEIALETAALDYAERRNKWFIKLIKADEKEAGKEADEANPSKGKSKRQHVADDSEGEDDEGSDE